MSEGLILYDEYTLFSVVAFNGIHKNNQNQLRIITIKSISTIYYKRVSNK